MAVGYNRTYRTRDDDGAGMVTSLLIVLLSLPPGWVEVPVDESPPPVVEPAGGSEELPRGVCIEDGTYGLDVIGECWTPEDHAAVFGPDVELGQTRTVEPEATSEQAFTFAEMVEEVIRRWQPL